MRLVAIFDIKAVLFAVLGIVVLAIPVVRNTCPIDNEQSNDVHDTEYNTQNRSVGVDDYASHDENNAARVDVGVRIARVLRFDMMDLALLLLTRSLGCQPRLH